MPKAGREAESLPRRSLCEWSTGIQKIDGLRRFTRKVVRALHRKETSVIAQAPTTHQLL
jgi:hypothetical protein